MKKIYLLFLLAAFAIATEAQIETHNSVSTSQEGGRYEIVQSPILRKLTFKLDKTSGVVKQMVKTETDGIAWQSVYVEGLLDEYDNLPQNWRDKINFQIFMSGTMARDCFLLNIITGQIWVYVTGSSGEYFQKTY